MQVQYKLYKIDKQNISDVMKKIANMYAYIYLNDSLVAIQYDYSTNGYKELLEYMSDFCASQYIITTSIFYDILSEMVIKNFRVYEIKLNVLFEEDNDNILKFVNKMNSKKSDKEKILHELLDELKWYNYDEGIDIEHMSFGLRNRDYYTRFHIYNNGVIAIDEESCVGQIFELLKDKM